MLINQARIYNNCMKHILAPCLNRLPTILIFNLSCKKIGKSSVEFDLCDKIRHQHVRDDDNNYKEKEFDPAPLYCFM